MRHPIDDFLRCCVKNVEPSRSFCCKDCGVKSGVAPFGCDARCGKRRYRGLRSFRSEAASPSAIVPLAKSVPAREDLSSRFPVSSVHINMSTSWLKILALIAGVLSAAPAGTCCSTNVRASHGTAAAARPGSCCHKSSRGPSTPLSTPCKTVSRCCCQVDATPPDAPRTPVNDGMTAWGTCPPPAMPPSDSPVRVASSTHPPGSPVPLRILLCVWRC